MHTVLWMSIFKFHCVFVHMLAFWWNLVYFTLEFYSNNWVVSCNELSPREVFDEMC